MGFLNRWFGDKPASRSNGLPQEGSVVLASGAIDSTLLDEWRWLVATDFAPVLCTACGDLFLQRADGAVYWLDVANGSLRSAARSGEALDLEARDEARFEEWFRPSLQREASSRHGVLSPGECYSWRSAPGFGGASNAANLVRRSLSDHFASHGRAFAAVGRRRDKTMS